jgi:hypothetical protein
MIPAIASAVHLICLNKGSVDETFRRTWRTPRAIFNGRLGETPIGQGCLVWRADPEWDGGRFAPVSELAVGADGSVSEPA